METPRAKARRLFEESLVEAAAQYDLAEDWLIEVETTDAQDQMVVVAYYKLYADGYIECCAVLDEVLWPSL